MYKRQLLFRSLLRLQQCFTVSFNNYTRNASFNNAIKYQLRVYERLIRFLFYPDATDFVCTEPPFTPEVVKVIFVFTFVTFNTAVSVAVPLLSIQFLREVCYSHFRQNMKISTVDAGFPICHSNALILWSVINFFLFIGSGIITCLLHLGNHQRQTDSMMSLMILTRS